LSLFLSSRRRHTRSKRDWSSECALPISEAQFRVAQAQLVASQATVEQKQAALAQAQVDLDHTRITAPVNGIVVSRQVDVGQTVRSEERRVGKEGGGRRWGESGDEGSRSR